MKIVHLNYSDSKGGAARAAYRLHTALLAEEMESSMWVVQSDSGDWTVYSPKERSFKVSNFVRQPIAKRLFPKKDEDKAYTRCPAMFPSVWPRKINESSMDIVNLHWIGAEMLSIGDFTRIKKPVVWTLHDMWAFAGAEHLPFDSRWRTGYSKTNRSQRGYFLDSDEWVWRRKKRIWKRPMQIVTPSRWLARCVNESELMKEWPVTVIPNPIDTDVWKPIEKPLARRALGLPEEIRLVAFGAENVNAYHKGFDLLVEALGHLRGEKLGLHLIVFGQQRPKTGIDFGVPVYYIGSLRDELSMRVVMNAADLLVIPSRVDNLPNTGVEAMCCGTPVVAFDTCGLPDIITHKENGWLARPFDAVDLAAGIQWIFEDDTRFGELCSKARMSAVEKYSRKHIVDSYVELYRSTIAGNLG